MTFRDEQYYVIITKCVRAEIICKVRVHFRTYQCTRVCSKYEWSNELIVKTFQCDGELVWGVGVGGGGEPIELSTPMTNL